MSNARIFTNASILFLLLLMGIGSVEANISLASPFSNHMVLQREMAVPVWGTAASGEKVTLAFRGQTKTFTTGADGKWMVRLDPTAEGGPFELVVQGNNTITVTDVLVGEVWVGGGQSNMERVLSHFAGPNLDTIKVANYPNLRLMSFAKTKQWNACTPTVAGDFSATGFYFGKYLHQALNVPVGIIINAIGGTDLESWLDPASVASDPLIAKDTSAGNLFRQWVVTLAPFAIRGVIWFQGENNASFTKGARSAQYYGARFKSLIPGWRTQWGQGAFPFYYAQLANYLAVQTAPGENSPEAVVREGQRLALSVPNTEMAVTIDIGEAGNIHPVDKWDVGRRLLLPALANLYGQPNLVYSGPMYQSMKVQGATVRVFFKFAIGLAAKGGGKITGFELAGANNRWSFADAAIHGDTAIVSASAVTSPTQVRYAWANNPVCNLINAAGLPASPFQADGSSTAVAISSQTPGTTNAAFSAQADGRTFNALGRIYKSAKRDPGGILFVGGKGAVSGVLAGKSMKTKSNER